METKTTETPNSATNKSTIETLTKEELITKYKSLLGIAKKAKQAKDEATEENRKLKELLSQHERQQEADKKIMHTMKEMLEQLTEDKLKFVEHVRELEGQNKTDKDAINQLTIETESLKRQIDRLTEDNENLLRDIDQMEEKLNQVNLIGKEQRKHIELLEPEVNKLKECESQVEYLKAQLQVNQVEKENLSKDFRQSLKEKDKLIENLNESLMEKEKSIKDLQESARNQEELVRKCEKLEGINAEQGKKLNSIKERFIDVNGKLKRLKECKCSLLENQLEYYENVTKWQGDIRKASSLICAQINQLSLENEELKRKQKEQMSNGNGNDNGELAGYMGLSVESLTARLVEVQELSEQSLQQYKDLLTKFENTLKENEVLKINTQNEKIISLNLSESGENEEMLNDVLRLEEEVRNLKKLLDENEKRVKEVEEENSSLQEKISSLENQEIALRDENSMLQESQEDLLKKEIIFKHRIEALERCFIDFRAQGSSKDGAKGGDGGDGVPAEPLLVEELIDLQQTMKAVQCQLSDWQEESEVLKMKIKCLEKEKDQLEVDNEAMQIQFLETLESKEVCLKKSLEDLKVEHEKELESLRKNSKDFSNDSVNMENTLKEFQAKEISLQEEVVHLKKALAEERTSKGDESNVRSLKAENTFLKEDLRLLQNSVKILEENYSKMHLEKMALESGQEDTDQVKKLKAEVAYLKDEIKTYERSVMALEEQYCILQESKGPTYDEDDRGYDYLRDLDAENFSLKEELKILRSSLKTLQEENSKLPQQGNKNKQGSKSEQEQLLDELKLKNACLQETIDDLKFTLSGLEEDFEILKNENEALKVKRSPKDYVVDNEDSDVVKELKAENAFLKDEMKVYQRSVMALEEQYCKLQEKMNGAKYSDDEGPSYSAFSEIDHQNRSLKNHVKTLKQSLKEMEEKYLKFRKENTYLNSKLKEQVEEIEKLRSAIQHFEKDKCHFRKAYKRKASSKGNDENCHFRNEKSPKGNDDNSSPLSSHEEEVEKLRNSEQLQQEKTNREDFEKLQQRLRMLEEENSHLRKENQEKSLNEDDMKILRNQIQNLEEENSQLREGNQRKSSKGNADLKSEISNLQQELNILRNHIQNIEEQNSRLRQEKVAEGELELLRQTIQTLKEENCQLRKANDDKIPKENDENSQLRKSNDEKIPKENDENSQLRKEDNEDSQLRKSNDDNIPKENDENSQLRNKKSSKDNVSDDQVDNENVSSHEKELEILRNSIRTLKNENGKLRHRIQQENLTAVALQQARRLRIYMENVVLQSNRQQVDSEEGETLLLRERVENLEELKDKLSEENRKLKTERDAAHEKELDTLRNSIRTLEDENFILRKDYKNKPFNEDGNSVSDNAREELILLRHHVKNIEEQNSKLRQAKSGIGDIELLRKRIKILDVINRKLLERIDRQSILRNDQNSLYMEELEILRNSVGILKEENCQLREKVLGKSSNGNVDLKLEISNLQQEVNILRNHIQNIEEQNSKLRQGTSTAGEFEILQERIKILEYENSNLRNGNASNTHKAYDVDSHLRKGNESKTSKGEDAQDSFDQETDLVKLRNIIRRLKEENSHFRNETSLAEELQHLRNSFQILEEENLKLRKESSEKSVSFEEELQILRSVQEQYSKLMDENCALEEFGKNDRIQKLTAEKLNLQEELEELQNDLKAMERNYKRLEEDQARKIVDMDEEDYNVFEELHKSNKALREELRIIKIFLSAMEKQHGQMGNEAETFYGVGFNETVDIVDEEGLQEELRVLEDQNSQQREQNERVSKDTQMLHERFKALETQNCSLNEELMDLRKTLNVFEEGNSKLEKILITKSFEDGSKEFQETLQYWEGKNSSLTEDLKKVKESFKSLEAENEKLKKQVKDLETKEGGTKKLGALESRFRCLSQDFANALNTLAATKNENRRLQKEVARLRLENSKLGLKCQGNNQLFDLPLEKLDEMLDLRQANQDLKASLNAKEKQHQDLLNVLKELNEDLRNRSDLVGRQQEQLQELHRQVEKMSSKLENYEQELKNKNEELALVLTQNSKVSAEICALSRDNQRRIENLALKDSEIEALKKTIKDLEQNLLENEEILRIHKEELSTLKTVSTNLEADNQSDVFVSTSTRTDLEESFEEKYNKMRAVALKMKKKLQEQSTAVSEMEKKLQKYEESETNVKVSHEQLQKQLDSLKQENQKLKSSRKQANVLNLEIEAAEKSLNEVSAKLTARTNELESLRATLSSQETTIKHLKDEINILESAKESEFAHSKDLKNQIDLLQKQLTDLVHEKQTSSISTKQLEQAFDTLKREAEDLRAQLSASSRCHEQALDIIQKEKEHLTLLLEAERTQNHLLVENLKRTEEHLDSLRAEYVEYKIKAQAVLRKTQTKDSAKEKEMDEEIQTLRQNEDRLNDLVQEYLRNIHSLNQQLSSLHEENLTLQNQNEDGLVALRELRQERDNLAEENQRLLQNHQETLKEHRERLEQMDSCHKLQLEELEKKHQEQVEQLKAEHNQTLRHLPALGATSSTSASLLGNHLTRLTSDQSKIDFLLSDREDVEGSEEAIDTLASNRKISTTARPPTHDFMPLDELLNAPMDLINDTVVTTIQTQRNLSFQANDPASESNGETNLAAELEAVTERLHIQESRVKHLTSLLAENEQDLAKFNQMNEMLKEELRRQERSAEREKHMHNAEYLKNVILKFFTLSNADERLRLVPVLQTILRLTKSETDVLNLVAKGQKVNSEKSWSSLLSSWTGASTGNYPNFSSPSLSAALPQSPTANNNNNNKIDNNADDPN